MNFFKFFLQKHLIFLKGGVIISNTLNATSAQSVGVYDDEGPPVPLPNTVVKLIGAENTWFSWEDRTMPTHKFSHPIGWLFFYSRKSTDRIKQPEIS